MLVNSLTLLLDYRLSLLLFFFLLFTLTCFRQNLLRLELFGLLIFGSFLGCGFFFLFQFLLLQFLEGFRVCLNLSLNRINILLSLPILVSNAGEDFTHLPERINFANVLSFSIQESSRYVLNLLLLPLVISSIVDSSSVRQSIVHCQFLLQIPDFLLVSLDLESRILHDIDSSLVLHFHHPRGKFECR